ncbi:unnamed protein product [Bursaphelenchus xylophilus]|uniref:(pine wood nematode) hypothetical protein n=1 Tax=Bursaphelenchus xylophilus TaxID=6326 RepID=A0A1I7S593_BURXY|nr:unnamed protein product [Bursaphelenchus xylophilus]CAG9117831.1 unnamed protein product [Bursaphelenchus xylophilus]
MGALLLVAAATLAILYIYRRFCRPHSTLPPGPTPWPLVGNLWTLKRQERWETKFIEWRREFGPVYTYWMGPLPIVAINEYQLAHKYFVTQGDAFSGRMYRPELCKMVRGGQYGLIDTFGENWSEQRRFALKTLRDFGYGKNQMECMILAEFEAMCRKLNRALAEREQEHDIEAFTDLAVGSVINSLLCGFRFTENDREAEFAQLKATTTKAIQLVISEWPNLVLNNLWLLNVPYIGQPGRETIDTFKLIFDYIDNVIQDHLDRNDYTQELQPESFIDAYLMEIERRKRSGNLGGFSVAQLRNVCFDLWIAGQETSSTSMTWALAYLIRYPEVQAKIRQELDTVIRNGNVVRIADRTQLPYIQAVIMEIQRCSNVAGQNIPHTTTEDVVVEGYFLPKGTITVPQISVMMMDPEVFPNPDEFNPDRFIDENGNFAPRPEHVPFSLGKRQCVGEPLGRMEVFLFISNLCLNYEFAAGKVPPTLKKIGGNATVTEPFTCLIKRRK